MYDNWNILSNEYVEENKSQVIHLRHKKTGFEVLHLLNDDSENLFGFAFKTLPENSAGIAHILEHSVLCGSKNYPLKDPFMQLNSQSVKTFLNAMTFPDKTVYPASSVIEEDYFNLMAVYGDAVFFPLLSENIFMQEAHRFELDSNNNISVQGVVFNEMQGVYSSFESIASRHLTRAVLDNTVYAVDSGGDPLVIPSLTYEQFLAFHKKYYHPSNAKLFLYGNIPTEKQLDFIEKKFLYNIQKSTDILPSLKFTNYAEPRTVHTVGPASQDEKGATVTLNWVFGESTNIENYMQCLILSEILMGHDGAALTEALLKSGLGEDIAPQSGLETELAWIVFSAGLRGVKKENIEKVQDVILKTLNDLVVNGINADDIEAALLSVDFAYREIKRAYGPWSLTLMRRTLRNWLHNKNPLETLKTQKVFDSIRHRMLHEKNYVVELIKKLLVENNNRLLFSITPDEAFNKNREKEYKQIIQNCPLSINEIKNQQKKLQIFQSEGSDEKTRSLIPHLKPSQLKIIKDIIPIEKSTIGAVPCFTHETYTNGIIYLNIGFPVDVLEARDYPLLSFYAAALTSCGFEDYHWAEAARLIAKNLGGFGATPFTGSIPEETEKKAGLEDLSDIEKLKKMYAYDSFLGRPWMLIQVKINQKNLENGIKTVFSCIETPNFSDSARLKDLLTEYKNNIAASVIPAAHHYAALRAGCTFNRSKAIEEIWQGLSQLSTAKSLVGLEHNELKKRLEAIHHALLNAGMFVHITADTSDINNTKKILALKLKKYVAPTEPRFIADKEIFALTKLDIEDAVINSPVSEKRIAYHTFSETGFSAASFKASSLGTKESIHETLFAHWVTNNHLWEKIRTKGGAYGAYLSPDAIEQIFTFISFRDPNPEQSLNTLLETLQEVAGIQLDDSTMERVITGSYSKEIQPRTPQGDGFTGLIRLLYGIDSTLKERKLTMLLNTTSKDIQKIGHIVYEHAKNARERIICGEKNIFTGINVKLSL